MKFLLFVAGHIFSPYCMINGLGGVKVIIIIVIVSDDEKGCCRFYTKKLEFDVRIEDICLHVSADLPVSDQHSTLLPISSTDTT